MALGEPAAPAAPPPPSQPRRKAVRRLQAPDQGPPKPSGATALPVAWLGDATELLRASSTAASLTHSFSAMICPAGFDELVEENSFSTGADKKTGEIKGVVWTRRTGKPSSCRSPTRLRRGYKTQKLARATQLKWWRKFFTSLGKRRTCECCRPWTRCLGSISDRPYRDSGPRRDLEEDYFHLVRNRRLH